MNDRKYGENPLGSWNDLKPTFSGQVKALLKKNLLIRIRNISSIIEIICAFIILVVGYLDYLLGETAFSSSPSPQVNQVSVNSMTEWFLAFGPETKVVCLLDKPLMRYLIWNTTFLKTIINGGTVNMNGATITLPGTQLSYVNEFKDLKNVIQSTNYNKMGFEWENIDQIAIKFDDLTKVYKGTRKVTALNSVSFDVNRGEVIVMIGPNGAGKSTMINCMSGGIKPTNGTISILGENTIHNLGVCYQNNVLIPQLSVQEHFELFGAFRGISKEILQSSIEFLSENMQLFHILKNRAGDLSGGQKRKLCICLSLLGNPEIVLMDEPTAGVDVQACQLIWKIISSLKNTTSFITSHALEEAEVVSSRLFILSDGILRFIGTSTELREQFKCGYDLRVETLNNNVTLVLDFVKKYIPEAKIADDRSDVILMPVCLSIGKFLLDFREKQDELGVLSYSFAVQQLEDMLLKS
ncbi:hypothetical protein M9Y10_030272 [Tritrichomonas musculus]|uniref:ABC transporter domain-containing protein n=1 Tax=Tritrichomonas musculus TaxID=1915356 RepID=A0ABR2KST9_9EUKA